MQQPDATAEPVLEEGEGEEGGDVRRGGGGARGGSRHGVHVVTVDDDRDRRRERLPLCVLQADGGRDDGCRQLKEVDGGVGGGGVVSECDGGGW